MTENNYSLLRPFDIEAAMGGTPICFHLDGEVLNVDHITQRGSVVGHWSRDDIVEYMWGPGDAEIAFRMAPEKWVDGKPIYKDSEESNQPIIEFPAYPGKKFFIYESDGKSCHRKCGQSCALLGDHHCLINTMNICEGDAVSYVFIEVE